jgi:hypothetical protein
VPEFLSVIAFGALVVPLGVLEKLTDDGDTVSFGEVWASEDSDRINTLKPSAMMTALTLKCLSIELTRSARIP